MGVLEKIGKKGVGEITLYTISDCKYCQALKGTLQELRIPFTNIDVEQNEAVGDYLESKLGTEYYPIICIKKAPEEYTYIISETNLEKLSRIRIFNSIEEALEILLQYYYEIQV
tara:strand:+ start:156 stop:497 length:342 start_codon:yes stop_codon:yes gene_type:complete